jgi:hypothetical protein
MIARHIKLSSYFIVDICPVILDSSRLCEINKLKVKVKTQIRLLQIKEPGIANPKLPIKISPSNELNVNFVDLKIRIFFNTKQFDTCCFFPGCVHSDLAHFYQP